MSSSNLLKKKEKKHKEIINKLFNSKKEKLKNDKKIYDELSINNKNTFYSKEELNMINDENHEIIKDNQLIQKSSFDFTELELKSLNYTLSKLRPDRTYTENDWIEYPLKDLIKMLNLKNGTASIELIKDSLHNLRTKGKWVKIESEKKEIDLSFFQNCEIENIDNKNIVRIRLMKPILEYLQNLKKYFTPQYLVYTMRLKGKYAIRLYELCKSYQNNYIKELDINGFNFYIEKIKKLWCLPDIYRSNDIKRILEKSIKEINKKTDIQISIYDNYKIGTKINYYILKIELNNNFNKVYKDIEKERHKKLLN